MSRIISENAAAALLSGRSFKQSNTRVEGGSMYLHDNEIARYDRKADKLEINLCGWVTLTTCERLNALPGVNIKRRKGTAFLNGEKIDSNNWILID